jgi:hypothetical protein
MTERDPVHSRALVDKLAERFPDRAECDLLPAIAGRAVLASAEDAGSASPTGARESEYSEFQKQISARHFWILTTGSFPPRLDRRSRS